MSNPHRRCFTAAARDAAAAVRKAKREGPDRFGEPESFVVKASGRTFTWELRHFGGIVLQRGAEGFDSVENARSGGEAAKALLCATPDRQIFKRELQPR